MNRRRATPSVRRWGGAAAAVCVLGTTPALAQSAAPPPGVVATSLPPCAAPDAASPGATQLQWQVQPAPWRVGQPVVLTLRLCPVQARLLAMDATMPEHRHGMNYQPQLKALGDGLWQVQGVLLHMAGRWELRFDTEHQGRRDTRRESLVLR